MKKPVLLTLFCFLLLAIVFPFTKFAQSNEQTTNATYFTGTVTGIEQETKIQQQDSEFYTQEIRVQRNDTNQEFTLPVGTEFQPLNKNQLIPVGKKLILAEQTLSSGEQQTIVADVLRLPTVLTLFVLFCVVVIIVGKLEGLYSIFGMLISLGILMNFILPQILAGGNPIFVSLIGSCVIGAITVYLSHGFRLKSHLALGSMMLSLLLVSVISYIAVQTAQLVGLGSEEAYFLQFGNTSNINLQGLLLGGIMLGALGVLDDITVSQVAVVFQLRAVKKKISFKELYMRGLSVGQDHVASLVNTLVLAYAGANLPLFLLFTLNDQIPKWVTLNSEVIVEEVIRTLAGSIGLVLAVPLATALAAYFAIRRKPEDVDGHGHVH